MSIQEYRVLQTQIDAHIEAIQDLRKRANEALCRQYGLVPGVTVLRSEGITGVFQEVLNYFEGQLPWVSVHTEKPITERGGRQRHFYKKWEIVNAA